MSSNLTIAQKKGIQNLVSENARLTKLLEEATKKLNMTPEKPTILRVHEEKDRTDIEAAATADALPVMDWIRATAIREARKRVAQLKANTGKA